MKNIFITLSILAFAASMPFSTYAQKAMVWDDWGLGFTLAPGMKITENNGEVFSAERDDLHLTIIPVEDAWAGEDDLAEAVLLMMEEMNFDKIDEADEIENNDLYGYYIEGQSEGVRVVVMALMDNGSHRNFLLSLVYTLATREEAIQLVNSMYAYDK